jgi:hypothetical protein
MHPAERLELAKRIAFLSKRIAFLFRVVEEDRRTSVALPWPHARRPEGAGLLALRHPVRRLSQRISSQRPPANCAAVLFFNEIDPALLI